MTARATTAREEAEMLLDNHGDAGYAVAWALLALADAIRDASLRRPL